MDGQIRERYVKGMKIKYKLAELPKSIRWLKEGEVYIVNSLFINLFFKELPSAFIQ